MEVVVNGVNHEKHVVNQWNMIEMYWVIFWENQAD